MDQWEAVPGAANAPAPLDHGLDPKQHCEPMKTAARKPNRKPGANTHPQMTRQIAEARAVGGGKGRFDGVAFLRTLKK